VYWAAVLLTFVVTAAFGLPGLENRPWEALVNLTMLQRLFGAPHIDDVYWTLTVELAFYGLIDISSLFFKTQPELLLRADAQPLTPLPVAQFAALPRRNEVFLYLLVGS
jgi:peptidoglycan/LPS O-acetylase OafA/YrhL